MAMFSKLFNQIIAAAQEAQTRKGMSLDVHLPQFRVTSGTDRPRLKRRTRYLQIALNRTLSDAERIIQSLPASDRIILEAGTPLIKSEGMRAVRAIETWGTARFGRPVYVVADLKTMDRGATEVDLAVDAGASGVVALGSAPVETLNQFIARCAERGVDSMLDMMNIEFPIEVLGKLTKRPDVVILHRGVDETTFNKEKPMPYAAIQRIKGTYNLLIAVAGGDAAREAQRAIFNGADIVIVWQSFYQASGENISLAETFLKEVK